MKDVTLEALSKLETLADSQEPGFFFTEFGDSSINFVATVWFSYHSQKDLFDCRSEAIMAVKEAFDANDITIPFPIRTLDFDPNGGIPLQQMWPEGAMKDGRREA